MEIFYIHFTHTYTNFVSEVVKTFDVGRIDGFIFLELLVDSKMVILRTVQSEIHFTDSDRHNITLSLHKETLEGRPSKDFEGRLPPNTLVLTIYKSDNLVEISQRFRFSRFQEFFGSVSEDVDIEYSYTGEEPVHTRQETPPDRIVIEEYPDIIKEPLTMEFDNEFEAKPTKYYGGGSSFCECCNNRRPHVLITDGPNSVYMDRHCINRMIAVYDLIREVYSDVIMSNVI